MKMSAVSTCTRFWRAGIEPAISGPVSGTDERFSPLKPTPELLRVSERISRYCSYLEYAGTDSNQLSVLLAPSITTGTTISVALGVEPIYAGDQSQHPVPHTTN